MSLDNYKGQRVENRATVINDVYTIEKEGSRDQEINNIESTLYNIHETLLLILKQLELITGKVKDA